MKVVLGADTAGFSRGMGGALASIGKFKLGVIAAGVAVVALGVKMGISAVKKAAAFEFGMAKVKAISGATAKEFKALTAEAKRLGLVTAQTMTDIATGMEAFARVGFDTAEIISAMGGAVALAESQVMDLGRAVEITAGIINSMRLAASASVRVVNALAAAASSAATTVEDISEAMKYLAPVAADLGVSLEEALTIVGKLADANLRGGRATRALSTGLKRLAAPTDEMLGVMDGLVKKFFDANGEFIGLIEVVGVLEKAFVGLTDQQKLAALSALFGAESSSHFSILIAQGAEALEKYRDEITDTTKAFDQQAAMLDTLKGQWQILTGSIELLLVTIGTPSLGALKNLTTAMIDVVNTVTAWKESTQLVSDAVSEMGDEAEGAEKKIISLSDRILDLTGGMVNLKGVIFGVMNAIRFIWDLTFGAIVAAIKIVMNALVAVIKLLQGDWKGAWEATKNMLQAFADYFLDIFRDLAIAFQDFIADIKNWWSGMWLGLKRDMTNFANFFIGQINWIIDQLNKLPFPDIGRLGLLEPPTPVPEPGRGIAGMVLETQVALRRAAEAAREMARAAAIPVITAPIEEAVDEITTCTEDVCGVLESVTEELSAFELALLAITVADVMNAPAKMAAELRKLGEQDIVAAAARTQELIRAMEAEIDALALFGLETEEVERYLKAFQDALGGPVSALEAIKWADVLAAPVKTAEKLAQLASKEAVAVAEYTRELIGSIETEIDALRMFGMETEETEKALALFRETIADITKEGVKLSDLWSPLRSILGQLTGTMGQLATSLVDLVQSFVEGGLSITNVTSAITFFVSMILGFIRKSIADLEKQIQDFEEQIRGLEEEIRMLEEEIRTFEEQIRDLEEVLAFYISTFEKIASVMNSLLSVLGPLGSVIGATVQAFVSAIKMTTLTGIELLNAGISMLTNYLNSLISTVLGLIQKSDAYQAVQEQGSRAWKAISDLFGQFLWPLAALLKHIMDWLGIQEKVKEAAAVEIGVPSAWKRMRRAYEAAAPGEIVKEVRGIQIPAWATVLVKGIAEAIEGVLEKFGISSWTDLLEAFKQGSIKFWTYVETKIPELVAALTSIFNTISDAIGGGMVDTIVGWLQKGFDWLINVAPRAVADFIRFTKMIWSLIGTVWNWLRTLDWDDIWRRIEDKFGEFGRTLEDLLDFTDTISAIDRIANEIRKLVTEIGRITTEIGKVRIAIEGVEREIERLKTVMKYIILMAAGAITGAIIGAAGFLSPAALIGALAGATAGGFLAWLSGQEAKGTAGMEWVSTGRGEGYWRRPRSFQLGGVVPGPIGAPRLARVHGGEEIRTYAQRQQQQPTQVFTEVHVYMGADEVTDFVVERIRHTSKLLTGSRSTAAGLTRRAYA